MWRGSGQPSRSLMKKRVSGKRLPLNMEAHITIIILMGVLANAVRHSSYPPPEKNPETFLH